MKADDSRRSAAGSRNDSSRCRLPSTDCRLPRLMLVTDGALLGEPRGAEQIAAVVRGGVGLVQLRDRAVGAAELLARARTLRRLLPETLLLVNDRVDVALAANADGVQLGAGALSVTEARRLMGAAALIGRSVHSLPEALEAEAEGADFLMVGTIYSTATHPDKVPEGTDLLDAVAAALPLPVYAIGGITAANATECIRHGAHGVAVIRAIGDAQDPEMAASQLLAGMG